MSQLTISNSKYLEQVKKILPDWQIEITPNDLMINPDKYNEVKITVKNKENSEEAILPLKKSHGSPNHFVIVTMNIASLISKITKENDLQLNQKICDHFSTFFEHKNN